MSEEPTGLEIAVIGMTGRFPGAPDLATFWSNLENGVESISFFSNQEMLADGAPPELVERSEYVGAYGVLDGVELFDPYFFGYNPREAAWMDPQHRLFLECAYHALEDAACDPARYGKPIGVYAGVGTNLYLLRHLWRGQYAVSMEAQQLLLGNEKDFLASRVSYKLNLKGPAMVVQTACSTSLVAIHQACQALINGECEVALAGGVSITLPQKAGYLYEPDGIQSPDGHCRAFDARAQGTVGGNGVGVVVLKRLGDALAEGDRIRAVVKGSAINNDGSEKVGFTAPSVEGQARVIKDALSLSGVPPQEVTYIEAHGTGTALGDPVEVAGLSRAYGRAPAHSCWLGSAKTNVGHLDAAAGIAGFIKTVLALEHRRIPPSLHFEVPNPRSELARGRFVVPTRPVAWDVPKRRRAGVSSLGMGGTNAHVILEEAPAVERGAATTTGWQILPLAARSEQALGRLAEQLAERLADITEPDALRDACYTAQVGRSGWPHRRSVIGDDASQMAHALRGRATGDRVAAHHAVADPADPRVLFLFPGQGSQFPSMGRDLYAIEPVFREWVDRGAKRLEPELGCDLRTLLFPGEARSAEAAERLQQTAITQPAVFLIEYALAKYWESVGVVPSAMLGHSIGEYVAACLAGVFSFDDALLVVATRGRLMQALPEGAMLSVQLSASELWPQLSEELSLAAINAPRLSVVAGPDPAIAGLEAVLQQKGIDVRRLRTSHAFHSSMMDPILDTFEQYLHGFELRPPSGRYVSNLTGTWSTPSQATDPACWARHLREPVRFSEGLSTLLGERGILVEVGAGTALSGLVKAHGGDVAQRTVIASLGGPRPAGHGPPPHLVALGKLWTSGGSVRWDALHSQGRPRKVELPLYPFERERCWVEPSAARATGIASETGIYREVFVLTDAREGKHAPREGTFLFLPDTAGLALQIAQELRALGASVVIAGEAPTSDRVTTLCDFTLDTATWFSALQSNPHLTHIDLVGTHMHAVTAAERVVAARSSLLALARVLPLEQAITCRTVDVTGSSARAVARELWSPPYDRAVAIRGGQRWIQQLDPWSGARGPASSDAPSRWLIAADMSGVNGVVAEALAGLPNSRLVIAGEVTPERLAGLRELGAHTELVTPASDAATFDGALAGALDRLGPGYGVMLDVLLRDVPPLRTVQELSADTLRLRLARTDAVLATLERALARSAVGAVWLQSSLATLTGALGQTEAACAYHAAESWAKRTSEDHGGACTAVAWDLLEEDRSAGSRSVTALSHTQAVRSASQLLRSGIPFAIVAAEPPGQRLGQGASTSEVAAGQPSRQGRPALAVEYVSPTTDTEEHIVRLWEELLGIEGIGTHDNFFDLGGHSLLATQIVGRLRNLFGVQVPLQHLYEAPTSAELALVIEELIIDELESSAAAAGEVARKGPA